MKVAIPTDSGRVAAHFGRCPKYTIVETSENNEIKNKKVIENPGHKPGFIPQFLSEKGTDCVITGGIGKRAISKFDDLGIKVISGVEGSTEEVIKQFTEGNVESDENPCEPGKGKNHGKSRKK